MRRIDQDEWDRRTRITRKAMKYTAADYAKDWECAIALSLLLADRETDERHYLLEDCFMRINAFQENNPDARPWL